MRAEQRVELTVADRREDRLLGIGAVAALVAGVGTVSCCIVPLALFSAGVTGAWLSNLTALSPYQPYLIALAAVFVGFGFWRVYRRPQTACAEGAICASPRTRRITKAALWLSVALVVAAIAFNYLAPVLLPAD